MLNVENLVAKEKRSCSSRRSTGYEPDAEPTNRSRARLGVVVGRDGFLIRPEDESKNMRYCSHCGCTWPQGQAFPGLGGGEALCTSCRCTEPHHFLSKGSFVVEGMCCTACQTAVARGLRRLDGVENVRVSYVLGKVHVDYDPRVITIEQIGQGITNAGYRCIVQGRVQPGSYMR